MMRRGAVLGPASALAPISVDREASGEAAEDEGMEADGMCRDATPSSAGWRYPSNHELKQESYACFSGVHSGDKDLFRSAF